MFLNVNVNLPKACYEMHCLWQRTSVERSAHRQKNPSGLLPACATIILVDTSMNPAAAGGMKNFRSKSTETPSDQASGAILLITSWRFLLQKNFALSSESTVQCDVRPQRLAHSSKAPGQAEVVHARTARPSIRKTRALAARMPVWIKVKRDVILVDAD